MRKRLVPEAVISLPLLQDRYYLNSRVKQSGPSGASIALATNDVYQYLMEAYCS